MSSLYMEMKSPLIRHPVRERYWKWWQKTIFAIIFTPLFPFPGSSSSSPRARRHLILATGIV